MPIVVTGKVQSPDDPSTLIIDLDRLKRDRDSIWAAAYMAYQDNPVHTFSSDELKQIKEYQENFRVDNPFDARVRAKLSVRHSGVHQGRSFVVLSDLYEWLEIPVDRHSSVRTAITDTLKSLGYQLKRVRLGGEPRRIWIKADDSAAA
jgi:predicted P-loop ATPase